MVWLGAGVGLLTVFGAGVRFGAWLERDVRRVLSEVWWFDDK